MGSRLALLAGLVFLALLAAAPAAAQQAEADVFSLFGTIVEDATHLGNVQLRMQLKDYLAASTSRSNLPAYSYGRQVFSLIMSWQS